MIAQIIGSIDIIELLPSFNQTAIGANEKTIINPQIDFIILTPFFDFGSPWKARHTLNGIFSKNCFDATKFFARQGGRVERLDVGISERADCHSDQTGRESYPRFDPGPVSA